MAGGRRAVSFVFRIVVGAVFLFAGLAKIADPVRFILTLREFRLFPEIVVPFLAVYLPWLEFVLGSLLVSGLLYRTSAVLLGGINGMFTLALLSVIARGIDIDCGCFGLLADILGLPDMADLKAVVRNLIFIGMCCCIFTTKTSALSLEAYIASRYPLRVEKQA